MVRNFVVLYGNCGIIWKLWYYGMEVVVLWYGSRMKVVIVE